MLFLELHFVLFLLAFLIKYLDLKVLLIRESPQLATHLLNYSYDLHLYLWSSLSFTLVLHLYSMSKLLNELNIMKLKLYVHIMPSGSFTLGLESEIF